MNLQLRSIVHPTDFSDLSNKALAHALRIALQAKSELNLVHVTQSDDDHQKVPWARLQRILAQWGLLEEDDQPSSIAQKLGVTINGITVEKQAPANGIIDFLNQKGADLVVFATHGRDGVERWLTSSVAESVFGRFKVAAIFIPPVARGFVSEISGMVRVRRALLPVDEAPAPDRALATAQQFNRLMTGADIKMDALHVGHTPPYHRKVPFMIVRSGPIIQTIVDTAVEFDVDYICMATAGRHGVLDGLRGSTTERVLRHAPCPVLAVPA